MAGSTTFKGPVRHGLDTGVSDTTTIGRMPVVQRATVPATQTSASTVFRLPGQTEGGPVTNDIVEFKYDVGTAIAEASGSDTTLEIGTSGDATFFARKKVSAVGRYDITVSDTSAGGEDHWVSAAGGQVFAVVSAGGSGAATTGTGILSVVYVPRND